MMLDYRNAQYKMRKELSIKTNYLEFLALRVIAYI